MPEVVVATEGRTWDVVFPIWKNDDQDSEWRIINMILEAIAMNNRFGGKTNEELKATLIKEQHEHYKELFQKLEGGEHDHKAEGFDHNTFGCGKGCEVPEDRTKMMEERALKFRFYGEWRFYLDEVFNNLAGAYREYK